MAAQAIGLQPLGERPTTFYFAYGSNLHLKQMKRRCPNSKFIGKARLHNYRWQINERGYANVIELEGYWVDGLVYEIDRPDEAKLDINEGVSKNAYTKRALDVHLHRADSTLYRRPTSWIVDQGGPTKILRRAKETGTPKFVEHSEHWVQKVLVYISLTYIQDNEPKDEYVNRINFGLTDARALGMDDAYIQNCIRPYIPPRKASVTTAAEKGKSPSRGVKRTASPRNSELSPARKQGPTQSLPDKQTSSRQSANKRQNVSTTNTMPETSPPPLPPRPAYRYHDIPVIIVEQFDYLSRVG